MSEPIPFDEHAERLKIRSSPKPVTRINRKVLMVGAGLGVLVLFAAASIALKPPTAVGKTSPSASGSGACGSSSSRATAVVGLVLNVV